MSLQNMKDQHGEARFSILEWLYLLPWDWVMSGDSLICVSNTEEVSEILCFHLQNHHICLLLRPQCYVFCDVRVFSRNMKHVVSFLVGAIVHVNYMYSVAFSRSKWNFKDSLSLSIFVICVFFVGFFNNKPSFLGNIFQCLSMRHWWIKFQPATCQLH